ncbi:DNA polymerase IV [Candidatus Falkowbacteria bacterium]|nr:DNA polymerase IV [Candidatus Falkowbacteria bacterium]
MSNFILHLDMNSYFASVEQQANSFLRGKPVGVCAYLAPRGCIIASSKEAKKLGIKVGCTVEKAKQIYPKIILVENEPAKYRSTTKKIFNILSDYTDRIEPYSIDEAFLDMTGHIKNWQQGEKIILEIKARIKKEVGEWLACSAGLSWTRFLAKFASDICEKDSYLLIDSIAKMEDIFNRVKITEAWGIKERMQVHLNRLGIFNLLDLKNFPVANIMQALGKPGYYLWANANGVEVQGIRTQEEILPKSIGHSYCMPRHTTDLKYLAGILMKLSEKTGRRLRIQGLEARGIYAGYWLKYGGGFFKSKKVPSALFTTEEIFKAAQNLLFKTLPPRAVTMLAVSVTQLQPLTNQLDLFYSLDKKRFACQAMDKINDKFGEYTIFNGTMWGLGDQAHDRIGFRKSVEIMDKLDRFSYEPI